MEKLQVHKVGLLHRAFSVFIFNAEGEMLLQKRAATKYHSPGLWTNACCSHPQPQETTALAASRRLKEELGFTTKLLPAFNFIYKTVFENGLTEHEYDHVFTGLYNGPVKSNAEEVDSWKYFKTSEIKKWMNEHPGQFTSWFIIAFPKLEDYLAGTPGKNE